MNVYSYKIILFHLTESTDYDYDSGLLTNYGPGAVADYNPVPPGYLRVVFFPNFTSLSFNVSIKEDSMTDEGIETFHVTIIPDSLPCNVTVRNNRTTISIIDSKYPISFTI